MVVDRGFHVVTDDNGRFRKAITPEDSRARLIDLGSNEGLARVASDPTDGQYAIASDAYAHGFEYYGKSLRNTMLSFCYIEVYQ